MGCGSWGHRKLDTIESKHTDTDTHRVLPKRTKIQKPTASIMCQTVKVSQSESELFMSFRLFISIKVNYQ